MLLFRETKKKEKVLNKGRWNQEGDDLTQVESSNKRRGQGTRKKGNNCVGLFFLKIRGKSAGLGSKEIGH